MNEFLVALVCLLVVKTACAAGAFPNVKGTWLPNSYQSTTNETMFTTMSNLKIEGVQRVYVDVWNQGVTYFESSTMRALVGAGGIGEDHLQWALDAGQVYGIEVHAWFEYGLMPSYGSINNDFAKYAQAQGWILGQYNNFYWMDPDNMDVLRFLGDIMTDAILQYGSKGLRGVQLDDHFASPISLGKTTKSMDSAMQYIRQTISGVASTTVPTTVLSLSPCTLACAADPYNVLWDSWGSLNYYDEVIPQLYRSTYESFKSEFDYTDATLSSSTNQKWTSSGIRVDGSAPTPWADVNNMLWYSNAKMKGSVVWYAHGIIEIYPSEFVNVWSN